MPRPKLPKRKVKKSVTLNDNLIKALTKLGGGNLSAGIEAMYQKCSDVQKPKLKPEPVEAE